MPSELDVAKRGLVKVVRELAAKYNVGLVLSRTSSDNDVKQAFRKLWGRDRVVQGAPWEETLPQNPASV